MGKTRKAPAAIPDVSFETIYAAIEEECVRDDASKYRRRSRLKGPPTQIEVDLVGALRHMVRWAQQERFDPVNEEDVQCFLYHALVLQRGTSTGLRAKPTHGKLLEDGMHFPDLIIGEGPEAVYIEIKVRQAGSKPNHVAHRKDVRKLAKYHAQHRRFFILWDCTPNQIYLSKEQQAELQDDAKEAPGCTVWHYPELLSESADKNRARKAITKMRENGRDLSASSTKAAVKAHVTMRAKKLAWERTACESAMSRIK